MPRAIPLQRTKKWLEDKGWHCWIVEHFNPWAHVRQDLYGLGDLIAIRHDLKGVWMVNACSDDSGAVSDHVKHYLNGYLHPKKGQQPPNPHLPVWLSGGNRFSIFGWGLRSSDGRGSRKVYTLRVVNFRLNGAMVEPYEVLPEALEVTL